jgi:hypothetical protein
MEIENFISLETLRPAAPLFYLILLIIFAAIVVAILTRGLNKSITLFILGLSITAVIVLWLNITPLLGWFQ